MQNMSATEAVPPHTFPSKLPLCGWTMMRAVWLSWKIRRRDFPNVKRRPSSDCETVGETPHLANKYEVNRNLTLQLLRNILLIGMLVYICFLS